MFEQYYDPEGLEKMAKNLFCEEREIKRLDGWFLAKEIYERTMEEEEDTPHVIKTAHALRHIVEEIPISISRNSVLAGSQRDAFAMSYALINPNFSVSSFNGYCDPTQVYNDIEPNEQFTKARIEMAREKSRRSPYVQKLMEAYESAGKETEEVVYFFEQVTGHLIPDFREVLRRGITCIRNDIKYHLEKCEQEKRNQYIAMDYALESAALLAGRYARLALNQMQSVEGRRKEQLRLMSETLFKIQTKGADNLLEALQLFVILWQVMCLEQSPNPFAFSVGNADRIFEPYREKEGLSRGYAAGLFKHFLVFFNVGSRSWAISQNILVGGRDQYGNDMTNLCSYALLDAYDSMNLPQPILSVKIHRNTPEELYRELGRFLFTPGQLTPSFFNDDSLFKILSEYGVEEQDLADYSIAGCQEPLIMGRDNGNTTNSWLNLAKILELVLNEGVSLLSGKNIVSSMPHKMLDTRQRLANLREDFYSAVEYFAERMVYHANLASEAISYLPVPFLSCFMGGIQSGVDVRDTKQQGTKYNGSGCLIHGLSVVADSLCAVDHLLKERPQDSERLILALKNDFEGYEELQQYLLACPKFGNNDREVDIIAAEIAENVAKIIRSKKNYLGNPFRSDYSTPSTHLIYGNLVGALPNGRKKGEMLNYGIDPLYGDAQNGLGFRVLSTLRLPYEQFNGGYASHLGLDPNYFRASALRDKGTEFKTKILTPLFFGDDTSKKVAPYYLYVNVTTPDILRKVLANPKKYAPSGVYIMRIHGTFVNFLDLSPEIQEDIIKRLDLQSTTN